MMILHVTLLQHYFESAAMKVSSNDGHANEAIFCWWMLAYITFVMKHFEFRCQFFSLFTSFKLNCLLHRQGSVWLTYKLYTSFHLLYTLRVVVYYCCVCYFMWLILLFVSGVLVYIPFGSLNISL